MAGGQWSWIIRGKVQKTYMGFHVPGYCVGQILAL